ncbi:DNA pilot protein [Sigmofec virus UA08Rod_6752]|uniref:DNA pilot protein n=1 Tax=Sigmofec virus UA08Rod_6752 TaxID=2929239 RepID=A0A976N1K3_9VIRU|nr:DNA pilot protein [Sigmofec virus UA08Rod_6752]
MPGGIVFQTAAQTNPYLAVGSSLLDFAGSSIMANSANAKNKRAQERANWYNVYNWQLQNEYNLPKNQVKRMVEGGLNPALLYGSGGSNLSSSGSISSPSSHPAVSGKGAMKILDNIAILNALKKQDADIDRVNAETESIDNGVAMERARLKLEQELQPVKVALMVAQAFNQRQSGKMTEADLKLYEDINRIFGNETGGKEGLSLIKAIAKGAISLGRR